MATKKNHDSPDFQRGGGKFYVASGSVRWTIGGCLSSRHAAQLFVKSFTTNRLDDIDDIITVAEAGWRSEHARDAEVFLLGEILAELREQREGGSNA